MIIYLFQEEEKMSFKEKVLLAYSSLFFPNASCEGSLALSRPNKSVLNAEQAFILYVGF